MSAKLALRKCNTANYPVVMTLTEVADQVLCSRVFGPSRHRYTPSFFYLTLFPLTQMCQIF